MKILNCRTVMIFVSLVLFSMTAAVRTEAQPVVAKTTSAQPAAARTAQPPKQDSLLAVFWNLENLFDPENTFQNPSDEEFSPEGDRHWTLGRYWKKCHGIAKTLVWMADEYGSLPAVAGLAEVENSRVMATLTVGTLLRKYGYRYIHRDSPDRRGIDVALIYREDIFQRETEAFYPIRDDRTGEILQTREILYACLSLKDKPSEKYHFIVNHHPSKYGGEKLSAGRRLSAMRCLADICDSLYNAGEDKIICMGDFNDTPTAPAFDLIKPLLTNLALTPALQGLGTIKYQGKWEMIDMFMVSRDLKDHVSMRTCVPAFLLTKDSSHPGEKPLRTYTGPRYAGGISDHLPIVLLWKPGP